MRHARVDYNRIQDPAGIIPEDEPVFLLRGQDKHAAETLRFYAALVADDEGSEEVIELTMDHADAIDAWPKNKAPDILKT